MIAGPSSPTAILQHHGVLLAMLGFAWLGRRSLGAWPTIGVAAAAAALTQLWLTPASNAAALSFSLADQMAEPILFFLLARSQMIPGLRRGRMTEEGRAQWIARHAFALPASRTRQPAEGIVSPAKGVARFHAAAAGGRGDSVATSVVYPLQIVARGGFAPIPIGPEVTEIRALKQARSRPNHADLPRRSEDRT